MNNFCSKIIPIFLALTLVIGVSCTKKTAMEGKVESYVGDVKVSGKPAAVEMKLTVGSEIVTGGDSSCEIVFDQKNIIRVLENSDIVLNLTTINKIIRVNHGSFETVLRNLNPDKKIEAEKFNVESSSIVAAVRGTTFYVKVDSNSNTSICACNGVVEMGSPGDTNRFTVESSHHTGFYFSRTTSGYAHQAVDIKLKDQTEMKKILGHNDVELEELAGKIGEKIDWTKVDKKQ